MGKALIIQIISLTLLISGCMSSHADLEAPPLPGGQKPHIILVKKVEYDEHGRPVFKEILKDRPANIGEQFVAVYSSVDNKPLKFYNIAVVGQRKPDMTKPLKVVFQWTGGGFLIGLAMVPGTAEPHLPDYKSGEDLAYAAASVAPIAVFTAGGFVAGLVAGVFTAAGELKNAVVDSQEAVLSYTDYEYDDSGRLKRLRTHLPDEKKTEVVRTEFFYGYRETVPYKTESTSYPEDKVRTIQ